MVIICGIIGFTGKLENTKQLSILQNVLIESRIRGKHASGIAWSDGKALHSYVKPISIDKLVQEFDWKPLLNKKLSLIAHARYSTSDIRYNQPIVDKSVAIVHNGVITQRDSSEWEKIYGYKCTTKNDSELLLQCVLNKETRIDKFSSSSVAAIVLESNGKLWCMRNGLRPLWEGNIGDNIVYASTFDILNRSGVTNVGKIVSTASIEYELQRRSMKWVQNNMK